MLKRLISKLKKSMPNDVHIIERKNHGISRTQLSENALKVLYRLRKEGYAGYLVGGGVRDILLGESPKDFDVVTDASPEQVHKLFRNSRLIGRRFRLVHVVFGRDMIEVATFRGHHDNATGKQQSTKSDSGMLLRDNVYGTIDEDAVRRDFTINALYYNIDDFSVRSYAGGINDIKNRCIRLIGDPETRYREDPVRMLRAIRFAAKLDFKIEPRTAKPIAELAPLLRDIPSARLFEEVLKLFMAGYALKTFELLIQHNLFAQLFPQTQQCINKNEFYLRMLRCALSNCDARIAQGKSLTPAFIFSVFLWPCLLEAAKILESQGLPPAQALHQAEGDIVGQQLARTAIPKRFTIPMREIWNLQRRLIKHLPKQIESITTHSRFRAAYDFLLLREEAGESLGNAGKWWTDYQKKHPIVSHSSSRRPEYPRHEDDRPSEGRRPRRQPYHKPEQF